MCRKLNVAISRLLVMTGVGLLEKEIHPLLDLWLTTLSLFAFWDDPIVWRPSSIKRLALLNPRTSSQIISFCVAVTQHVVFCGSNRHGLTGVLMVPPPGKHSWTAYDMQS